jgi:hypothetical protein
MRQAITHGVLCIVRCWAETEIMTTNHTCECGGNLFTEVLEMRPDGGREKLNMLQCCGCSTVHRRDPVTRDWTRLEFAGAEGSWQPARG